MKKMIKISLLIMSVFGLLLVSPMTYAKEVNDANAKSSSKSQSSGNDPQDVGTSDEWGLPDRPLTTGSVANVLNKIYALLGMIAVIMILIGGFNYVTSAGDESKIRKGKNTIVAAVVGLIIVILAYAITSFVAGITG